jgi:hypothetical protein
LLNGATVHLLRIGHTDKNPHMPIQRILTDLGMTRDALVAEARAREGKNDDLILRRRENKWELVNER